MRLPTYRNGTGCELDRAMTPMVDVVFQLLVFFVLASGGRFAEHSLPTNLSAGAIASPEIHQAEKPTVEHWIHLKRSTNGSPTIAELMGRKYADLNGLQPALQQLATSAREQSVILDVSSDVPLGDVILVYDACREARFTSINFAAAPNEIAPQANAENRSLRR